MHATGADQVVEAAREWMALKHQRNIVHIASAIFKKVVVRRAAFPNRYK
jgi:hypothetical protein